MTTEPITTGEVLSVTRAVHDVAQIMSVTLGSGDPAQWRAASYRATADFLEAFGKAATPGILRREADRIDPPTVPAEPDLTTPEGWIAEAKRCVVDTEGSDAFGWSAMAMPSWSNERQALSVAWHGASEPYASALAQAYMRSLGWVRP